MMQYSRYHLIAAFGFSIFSGVLSSPLSFAQDEAASKFGELLLSGIVKKSSDGGEVKTPDVEELKGLVLKPGFPKNILKWKVLDSISPEKMKELSGTSFLRAFLNNIEWQQAFFGSGPNPFPDIAISNLALLCKADPKALTNPIYRKLATATALEYARNQEKGKKPEPDSQWGEKKMLERYNYFRSSHAAGLLNPAFDKLDYWDMRILTGCGRTGFGDVNSLKWQRDNVRLPAQNYTGACWQAPYRLNNEWGESIHGRDYYIPFEGLYPGGTSQMTKEVGGVCGGLSHFGAYAAIANGIPALTMGEPGHCAYTVRVDEKEWVPAYSLSNERGCHWAFYGHRWAELILTQDIFSHQTDCAKAFLASWAGQMAQKSGDTATALALYETALQFQPVNYPIWLEYLDLVQKSGKTGKGKWKEISKNIMNAFSKNYPEMAWDILETKVYPNFLELMTNPEEKVREVTAFHKSLDKMLPIPWNFDKALDQQLNFVSDAKDPMGSMMNIVMSTHLDSGDYGPLSMTWCLNHVEGSPELMDQFISRIMEKKGSTQGNTLAALSGEMIKLAGKSGDIATFQAAGKLMEKEFKPSLPAFEPFPGELLSSGGMLQISSFADQYGEPWRLWGVIEACGGKFHTQNDDPAIATVIMPRIGELSGIVIAGQFADYANRCDGMVVESSLDGTTWTKLGTIEKMKDVNRIDLAGKSVKARLVRITRPGKNFFHLQGILIYGKRAS